MVRCEDNGTLGVYYEHTGGGIAAPFSVAIDGERFAVAPEPSPSGVPFGIRLQGDAAAIASALRSGEVAKLVDVEPPLNPGFDTIPLRGSGRAIGSVVAACSRSGDGNLVADGDLLRDSAGRVAIANLTDASDCAAGKGSGMVDVLEGDGVWFVDDQYGRGYINLDPLPPGPDLKVRAATLKYLLTPGRRLDIDVMGCGAAGRVEKLMAAREIPDTDRQAESPGPGTEGEAGVAFGQIEGELGYPSDFIPEDLKVCAERIDTNELVCTTQHLRMGGERNAWGYRLSVPAGAYHVFATFPPGSKNSTGFEDGYRAYYSEMVVCGFDVSCPSHAPVAVTVQASETVPGISPSDWYDAAQAKR